MALAAFGDEPRHGVHIVPGRLVARQSTDPAPAQATLTASDQVFGGA
jgi:hypothetical protein